MEGATETGVKHKLLVGAVVAHLSLKVGLYRIRLERQAYGVKLHSGCHERVEAQLAVDACRRRCSHIYISIVKVVAEAAQCAGEYVFASGIEVQRHVGQTLTQAQLVDISLLRLSHSLLVDTLQTLQYVLYRTAAVKTQRKVATCYSGVSRVAASEYVERYSLGAIRTRTVAHDDVANHSTCGVIDLKVARQVNIGTQRGCQRTFAHAHTHKVGIDKVARQLCIHAFAVHQGIEVDGALQQRRMAVEQRMPHSIVYIGC